MHDNSTIVHAVKERQKAMRRELDRRQMSMKAISMDSGIPYSTLLSYLPADQYADPHLMPVSAQYALCGCVPDDILSLLLPDGRRIVCAPEELDRDELEREFREFLRIKGEAHHPESPAGREISDCEADALDGKVAQIIGKTRRSA